MKAIAAGILLAALTFACGQRGHTDSAVQSLASSANDRLIADVIAADSVQAGAAPRAELRLSQVLERKELYGLGDAEVKTIQAAFTKAEAERLVLHFLDPNQLRGRIAPRWAYIPAVADDAEELRQVAAFDRSGKDERIDGTADSAKVRYPVITLSFSERIEGAIAPKIAAADEAADGGLMLDSVEFSDVREPWIKGSAEMYAVVSYIGKDGKGASALVDLRGVEAANQRYELRQILHIWTENRYQILNVAFFEHDSGYNYATLGKVFITAAAGIVTSVLDPTQTTTTAIIGIVSELAGKIIDALPDDALSDDDDFVDTINTIEKYTPGQRQGVGVNAKAAFSFYKVKINDE